MKSEQTHLEALENHSVFILREAHHAFRNMAMPWSMGKDSNVLLWLSLKAFLGQVPFPLLHIDTTYEFPEMLEFREWAIEKYGVSVIVKVNTEARERGIGYETHDPVTVTHELKTVALKQAIAEHKWDALITGIRRDEDPTRAKERYFSPRDADSEWHYKHQPPQFWGQFALKNAPGEHVRVQPLLDWTEVDIWRYIEREKMELPSLYYAHERSVAVRGPNLLPISEFVPLNDDDVVETRVVRFRTVGDISCTLPVESNAATVADIVAETLTASLSERGATRLDDQASEAAMEERKRVGYF
jgi:sulfate adenylyltransferase subunit 2